MAATNGPHLFLIGVRGIHSQQEIIYGMAESLRYPICLLCLATKSFNHEDCNFMQDINFSCILNYETFTFLCSMARPRMIESTAVRTKKRRSLSFKEYTQDSKKTTAKDLSGFLVCNTLAP